ncbi:MAG: hypothetical protein AB7R90_01010 [Reyranellaceae bacterium]
MATATDASGPTLRYWPLAALLGLLALFVAAGLVATDGHPTYLLDDAWIHLQFSEQIVAGHFGLVAGEKASPSSSILYPLLLTPLAGTSLHQWQPALWNLAALVAVLLLWRRLFGHFVLRELESGKRESASGLLALAAILFTNTLWLALTGMEHGLQIAATLAVAVGLLELLVDGRARWFLLAGLVLGPLLRLENFAITLPAVAVLLWHGSWRIAVPALALSLGGVLVHGLLSQAAGLPLFGAPILAKGWLDELVQTPLEALRRQGEFLARTLRTGRPDTGSLILAAALALALPWQWRRRDRPAMALAGIAIAGLAAQFLFGGLTRAGRHEIYAQCFALAALAYALRLPVLRMTRDFGTALTAAAGAMLVAALFPANLVWTASAPWAAQDIWRQHWQMRRFLIEHVRASAAVNDIGLVAYRNPALVLDLVGLGSEEVRLARSEGRADRDFYASLLHRHGIEAVLVYDAWFVGLLPPELERVAEFHLGRVPAATGGSVVAVYATSAAAAARLRQAAAAFAPAMPRGSSLLVVPR